MRLNRIARTVVGAAAVAMGLTEVVAIFVETAYAVVLALLFLLGAAWLWWRRGSIWPVVALALLFVLEILYLSDYDWNDSTDRLMIIATVAICSVGLLSAVAWFLLPRRRSSA